MFYANLTSPVIECSNQLMKYEHLIQMKYEDLVSTLRREQGQILYLGSKRMEKCRI